RTEHQRVRQNGRQQKSRDLFGDVHLVFQKHLEYDGGSTAHRHIAEIHRRVGLQRADAMVVDDFQNFRLGQAVYRLGLFVVIHQNDLLTVQVEQIPAGNHAAVFAVVVQDGEIAVADAG